MWSTSKIFVQLDFSGSQLAQDKVMMFMKDSWSVHIYCAMGIAVILAMTFG